MAETTADVTDISTRYCPEVKADGERCGFRLKAGEDRCIWHDPARADEVDAMRAKATEARREAAAVRARPVVRGERPPELEADLPGLVTFTSWAVRAIAAGDMDPKQASALSGMLSQLRSLIERRDLESELTEAKAALAALKRASTVRRRG